MNTDRFFKDALYEQFARISKSVANAHRLELLDLLSQGERRVDDLAHEAHLSVANTSQHLQALRRARLVATRRSGTAIYYRLADERVFRLWQAIRELGEARLTEVNQLTGMYLSERSRLEAIDAPTLLQRLREDEVFLLDVRPSVEFRAGHIPGAHSIPVSELESRLRELPANRDIVAYCRGPYCVFSDEAVTLLQEQGFRAVRFEQGLPEWRAAGYPVEAARM